MSNPAQRCVYGRYSDASKHNATLELLIQVALSECVDGLFWPFACGAGRNLDWTQGRGWLLWQSVCGREEVVISQTH